MFCPKCDKFVPSSATACPNCGIPIISGFSPNYGSGFALGGDDTESRNDAPPHAVMDSDLYDDAPPHAVMDSDLYDDVPDADGERTDARTDGGIGTRLKSLFGFGKN